MKILFKTTITLILITVISLSVVIYGNTAIEEQPSDLAMQFKEVWLPYILVLASALGGTAIGNTIINVIFKKTLSLLGISDDSLKKAVKILEKSNELRDNEIKELRKEIASLREENNKLQLSNTELTNECKEMHIKQKEYLKKQDNTNNKIIKVLEIAFLNNADLVRKGYASEISKVINDEENEAKEEVVI